MKMGISANCELFQRSQFSKSSPGDLHARSCQAIRDDLTASWTITLFAAAYRRD